MKKPFLSAEEKSEARALGRACALSGGRYLDNPYHTNWPNQANGGWMEEDMARHWVNGFYEARIEKKANA